MSKHLIQTDEVIDPKLLSELLEAIFPVSPPPGLRAKVLARAIGSRVPIELVNPQTDVSGWKREMPVAPITNSPYEGYLDKFMSIFDLGVEQTRVILERAAAKGDDTFHSCGIPGATLFYFNGGACRASATCGILKIKSGTIFPAHEHQGDEHVLILQGTAIEASGQYYRAGDVVYHQKGTRHSFRVVGNESMLLAVLLEKPNKWLKGQIIVDYLLKRWRFVGSNKK